MKLYISIVLLQLLLFFNATAEMEKGTFLLGARIGVGASNLKGDVADNSSKFNFHAGIIADYAFSHHYYMETGCFLTNKGCKYDVLDKTETINMFYLEFPILSSFRININNESGINLQFGPYAAIGVFGNNRTLPDEPRTFSEDGGFKRFDAGLKLAAGWQISEFSITFGYDIGCLNVSHLEGYSVRTTLFHTTFGYDF